MNTDTTSHIVLVEDHSLFAESLGLALQMNGYKASRVKVEEVHTPARLLNAILRHQPSMVLLDLDLGDVGSGTEFIGPLVGAGVVVVVVTSTVDRARLGECLVRGARTVISKSAPLEEILAAIARMAEGRAMMSPTQRDELVSCWRERSGEEHELRSRLALLTRREAEVLGDLMLGKLVSEIARERFVSESTVRTQVKAVLAKLQVSSQLTAVGIAHRAGWRAPGRVEG